MHIPQHRAVPAVLPELRRRASTAVREISVVVVAVLLVGAGAAQSAPPAGTTRTVSAAGAAPSTSPTAAAREPGRLLTQADRRIDLDQRRAAAPVRPPAPPAAVAPRPAPRTVPIAAPPAPRERWLPSGTGMWLHDWRRSEQGHAAEVVARAKRVGLTHLYVQTGSSRKGWIGEEVLSELMPATKGTGISVIAWDFPKLDDPEADARRLARAAFWNRPGAPMITAVAPDVETGAEGTDLRGDRVRRYYAELRKRLPVRTAILATVPWPSEKRTGSYPYATTAPFADAWIPMAYWYNRSPSVVTRTSMTCLARFGKPVMPVGQGYDGRLDAPYLKPDPHPDRSVAAFAFAARSHGARSISLWSWQTTGPLQWKVLREQARFYTPKPPKVPAPPPVPVTVAGSPSAEPTATAEPPPAGAEPPAEDAPRDGAPPGQSGRDQAPGDTAGQPRSADEDGVPGRKPRAPRDR